MSSVKSVFPAPVFLSAGTRSPIGKFGGSLKALSAPRLAAQVLRAAAKKTEENCDFVIMGHARQAGAGPNTARQAVIFSGMPESVPAVTLNQACASGMSAIISGAEKIAINKARFVWAGGVESMSNTPYLLMDARWGKKLGDGAVTDGMYQDGFHCPMADMVMGATVEKYLARELKISRSEQDLFALRSQNLAEAAWDAGRFDGEISAIEPEGKYLGLSEDEHVRRGTVIGDLEKLKPVFDPAQGTLTAGNSSGITDGAAFVGVGLNKNYAVQAELLDYEIVALDPKKMGLGPVQSTKNLLSRQGLKPADIFAVELNEAFAAQVLACQRELNFPIDKINAWGGAIALGHPIGASGARIIVTLMSRLSGNKGALGLATLCVSGGQGVAVLLRSLR